MPREPEQTVDIDGTLIDRAAPGDRCSKRADLVLRCAWLRAVTRREDLVAFDTDGQLRAQLLDFADVLEVADRGGWLEAYR